MWEKELEIIESLGKLYPKFNGVEYENWETNYCGKSTWVYVLCRYHLKRRFPRLEEFIKENNEWVWLDYKWHFNIAEEQCGKKS